MKFGDSGPHGVTASSGLRAHLHLQDRIGLHDRLLQGRCRRRRRRKSRPNRPGNSEYNAAPLGQPLLPGRQGRPDDSPSPARLADKPLDSADSTSGATASSGLPGHLHLPDRIGLQRSSPARSMSSPPAPAKSPPIRPATPTTTPPPRCSVRLQTVRRLRLERGDARTTAPGDLYRRPRWPTTRRAKKSSSSAATATSGYPDETWTFDGTDWTQADA